MYERTAATLREAAESGRRVRVRGGGTKLGWGTPAAADAELDVREHDRILEHNAGDLTAVVQAGVPLARLQEELRAAGQTLALDPPPREGATLGGVLATGDSGPLRHRHAPRDLVLGMTVALSDGTVARSGGKVIKNVAGYDLAKLFTGSFGTLGAILEVAVRLHPLPAATATAVARCDDPDLLSGAALQMALSPFEAQCLDVRWAGGAGALLARFAGARATAQAEESIASARAGGLGVEVVEDDEGLWDEQRAGQRAPDGGAVVRVSGVPTQLGDQLRAAERAGATLVARAAHGGAWIGLTDPDAEAVERLRRELAPSPCVVLDAPQELRESVDVWGVRESGAVELMRRVKRRFDPAGACAPGAFVGGI